MWWSTLHPRTGEAEAGEYPSSRPAWSTKGVPGQPIEKPYLGGGGQQITPLLHTKNFGGSKDMERHVEVRLYVAFTRLIDFLNLWYSVCLLTTGQLRLQVHAATPRFP